MSALHPIHAFLQSAMDEYSFVLSTAHTTDGAHLTTIGSPAVLPFTGTWLTLFSTPASVRRTASALEGRPRLLTQGTVTCVYLQVAPGVLAGFFAIDSRAPGVMYSQGVTLQSRAATALTPNRAST